MTKTTKFHTGGSCGGPAHGQQQHHHQNPPPPPPSTTSTTTAAANSNYPVQLLHGQQQHHQHNTNYSAVPNQIMQQHPVLTVEENISLEERHPYDHDQEHISPGDEDLHVDHDHDHNYHDNDHDEHDSQHEDQHSQYDDDCSNHSELDEEELAERQHIPLYPSSSHDCDEEYLPPSGTGSARGSYHDHGSNHGDGTMSNSGNNHHYSQDGTSSGNPGGVCSSGEMNHFQGGTTSNVNTSGGNMNSQQQLQAGGQQQQHPTSTGGQHHHHNYGRVHMNGGGHPASTSGSNFAHLEGTGAEADGHYNQYYNDHQLAIIQNYGHNPEGRIAYEGYDGYGQPTIGLGVVGFTGVDDTIEPAKLCDMSEQYSFVEWGVLLHKEREGKPRYASQKWINRLRDEVERRQKDRCEAGRNNLNGSACANGGGGHGHPQRPRGRKKSGKKQTQGYQIRLAAHLGGEYCLQALNGDDKFIRETLVKELGFSRIQLNPTKPNGVNESNLLKFMKPLQQLLGTFEREFEHVEFIFQVNKQTKDLAFALMDDPRPNLAFLYDSSMGAGKTPARRPVPLAHPGVHVGYAGGIGPHNLRDELKKVMTAVVNSDDQQQNYTNLHEERTIWLDMESSLRNKEDLFDITRCESIVGQLFDMGVLRDAD
ncbi:unnamed protein product [Amoebophrya sp. A120]|nr:unnamed protein product [Amoebophrya sp. A120]|eukprot:GSA120T00025656001.1